MPSLSSKQKGLIWIGLTAALAGGCAIGLPIFTKWVPWTLEKKISDALGAFPQASLCKDSKDHQALLLLQKLVQRIYPVYPEDSGFPIQVEVISGPTVNAFATLGGRIYVFNGLIQKAESPEELAGILAHEIEHVRDRHILQGIFVQLLTGKALNVIFSGKYEKMKPELFSQFLHMKFSRQSEFDADLGGLKRLVKSRVNTAGFLQFFERSKKEDSLPDLLSDHPSDEKRSALAKEFLHFPFDPLLTHNEWQTLKNGICTPFSARYEE